MVFGQQKRFAPRLGSHTVTLNEGETVVLSNADFSATDVDTANEALIFDVADVQHGQFSFVSVPGNPITNFSQRNITDAQVQFTHDGSEIAPSFKVSVSDGRLSTSPIPAIIDFSLNANSDPRIMTNQLSIHEGQTLVVTPENLSAMDVETEDASLIFTISNFEHGQFELINNPGIAMFTQQQIIDGQVRFVHDG
ncbi:MAG TPA: cadherin-like domain-containing protein, partial [Gammaproteobacteria bacterium]|nr:cadherin-like domain-containing protein [Gammaproteobacteria bacterium]